MPDEEMNAEEFCEWFVAQHLPEWDEETLLEAEEALYRFMADQMSEDIDHRTVLPRSKWLSVTMSSGFLPWLNETGRADFKKAEEVRVLDRDWTRKMLSDEENT